MSTTTDRTLRHWVDQIIAEQAEWANHTSATPQEVAAFKAGVRAGCRELLSALQLHELLKEVTA